MIGQTISHYTILDKLGEGGMGVVYKARDTKLDRDVALKFLPAHLAASNQDKARFIQEAKAAAALNHPNVCSIIDIQEHDTPGGSEKQMFIVMEFVDGQTLRERLSSSASGMAVSTKQAIDIGIQVADGLAAAHEKGIVHRDIKPENVMIRRDGLAQIMRTSTMTKLTKAGSTIGTVGYMSPEQVQGQETDHRSDIFSLGVVLFELFTGQIPFKGMHETAVAYEVVNVDSPPMSSMNQAIPPELDAIVLDCLEKDPRERTQAASQVALELKRYRRESSRQRASRITAARPVQTRPPAPAAPSRGSGVHETPVPATQPSPGVVPGEKNFSPEHTGRRRFGIAVLAVVAVVAVAAGYFVSVLLSGPAKPDEPLRLSVELPHGLAFFQGVGGHTAISPDGNTVGFVGVDSGGRQALWIRSLYSDDPVMLTGTDGAEYPFWSPDGRSMGFFAGGKLKRVDIIGSPPLTLADAPSGRGGAWSPSGFIVFAPFVNQINLFKIPASGGTPVAVTDHDTSAGTAPRYPCFLPDGDHFIYVTLDLGGGTSDTRQDYRAWVGSLEGNAVELPIRGTSNIWYASGHIIYLRQSTLIAQAFDPSSLTVQGDPVPIRTGINFWPQRAKGDFSVSDDGTLLFGTTYARGTGEILLLERNGTQKSLLNARPEWWMQFSPDGKLIVFTETQEEDGNVDLWTYDIARELRTRFTFNPAPDRGSVWSPDGSSIFYTSPGGGKNTMYRKSTDGMGTRMRAVGPLDDSFYPTDISPDGHILLVAAFGDSTYMDLAYSDLGNDSSLQYLLRTSYAEGDARFSPDGRWIVYESDESGRNEIYVRPFGQAGGKWQVSSGGGERAFWERSGEIFYRSGNQEMVVSVDLSGQRPVFGSPKPLFGVGGETALEVTDVSPDGKTFLARKTQAREQSGTMSVIFDWPGLTRK